MLKLNLLKYFVFFFISVCSCHANYSISEDSLKTYDESQQTFPIQISAPDTISKVGGKYYLGTKNITKNELNNILTGNPKSQKYFKNAETWSYVLMVPAVVGGFLIGWPIGGAIAGKDFNAGIFGAGLAIVTPTLIASILIDSSTKKKAIRAYNQTILEENK